MPKKKKLNIEFLEGLVGHTGDACVTWPFATLETGYGQLKFRDRMSKAHRVMCILSHGEPPTERHQAAHSCGNGHLGCVNPNHLSWKTASENQLDRLEHGTARKPGRPFNILTETQVAEIRALGKTETHAGIASKFGVHRETVGNILRGVSWTGERADTQRRFPPSVRDKMVRDAKRLRDRGLPLQEIGRRLGVSRATARNYVDEASS